MSDYEPTGKRPGKTQYSGTRRTTTRESGFHVHKDTTGGEFRYEQADSLRLEPDQELSLAFQIPPGHLGEFVGYGAWYQAPKAVSWSIVSENAPPEYTLSKPAAPNWGKLGSMWVSNGEESNVEAVLRTSEDALVGIWQPDCGIISHFHLEASRAELLPNMYKFSPEAHFYSIPGKTVVNAPARSGRVVSKLKQLNIPTRFGFYRR